MKKLGVFFILFCLSSLTFTAEQKTQFLADRHVARGVQCVSCHTQTPPSELIKQDKCLACHESYEKIAVRTEDLDINPHRTHMGEVECMACHRGHSQGEMVCNECHKFPNKVP